MSVSNKRRRMVLGAGGLLLPMVPMPSAAGEPEQVIPIGFAAGLGNKLQSTLSFSARDGALLAIEQANQRSPVIGGKPTRFSLMVIDDQSDPNFARIAARAFVTAKVAAVIGHDTTDTSVATTAIYADAGVAQVTPTATGRVLTSRGFQNVFQLVGHSDITTDLLASIAVSDIGAGRIAVLDNGTQLGSALAEGFITKLQFEGLTPVARESVTPKTSEFGAPLSRIKQQRPDLLFFAGVGPQVAIFLDNVLRMKLDSKLLVTGGAVNLEFPQAGPFPDRALLLLHGLPVEKRPGFAEFDKNYRRRYESALSAYSMFSYDAAGMLMEAIQRVGSADPRLITAEMHRLKYRGLSGTVAFAADGSQVNPPYTLYETASRRWQALKSFGG